MFKKYFFFLIFLGLSFALISSTHAHAFIDKSPDPVDWKQNATYTAEVVSQNDFYDTINIEVLSAPINAGKTAQLSINWYDNPNSKPQPFKTVTLDANGDATVTIPNHPWPEAQFPNFEVDVDAQVAGYFGVSGNATYKVKASYAETSLTNKQGYANNATIPLGTTVTFNCTNSSEMYFGSADNWAAAQLVDHDYGSQTSGNGGGLKGYALSYSPTFNTPGNYKVECDNIGGTASRNVNTFTVATAPVMTGALTASPAACLISAGANSCSTNLTWTTTNPVATSQVTASGMTSFTGNSGTNVVASVPYGGRTFYLYNNAQPLDQQTVPASCTSGTTWNGSICATNKTYFDITGMASSDKVCEMRNGRRACISIYGYSIHSKYWRNKI